MIWCVEDDASIRDIEVYALESTGFKAIGFEDGQVFWDELKKCETDDKTKPELIVLDIMLPSLDGIELLKRIKASTAFADIPIVMATAKGTEYDRIKGLDLGADYYLAKPFGVMELVSCVKAVLRRCKSQSPSKVMKFGNLVINIDERIVKNNGTEIALTYKEFELFKLFLANPGMIFSRDKLFNEIWGFEFYGESRTVDMHIRTLRQKLGDYGNIIRTVRNVGYGLDSDFVNQLNQHNQDVKND